jgi:two-component system sensor histidine kinase ChiS
VTLAKEQLKSLSERNKESSKKVEELIEYDKLKTEFFTNLSHELRTPLNVITSTIQLLSSLDNSRTLGDERIKYYFSIMNQNSLRLLRLVNNLIDLTKVDGGYLSLNFKNGNIVYFIEEITQSVAEYINTKGISIIFDTEIEEKIIAYDEEKIERIILNLLSNAVKFTNKKGNIFVNIYDKDDFIEISIKDTGIGIPSDKLDYVFERFAQVDRSLRRRSEGSGIGLSLVKSLVELHGGKISVKSEVDKGTEFIIELPVRTVGEEVISGAALYNEVPEQKYEKSLSIEFSDIYM